MCGRTYEQMYKHGERDVHTNKCTKIKRGTNIQTNKRKCATDIKITLHIYMDGMHW